MNIRNFVIIAHIDAGKSTLADRFLELTHTLRQEEMKEQVLDQMDLERERGITIKMQPCAMEYQLAGQKYQLNLIDTPGHMDFAYEVERSLAAVEGAVLLVDVIKGVQAQTLANLHLARKQGLIVLPVINKVDICPGPEQLAKVKQEIVNLLSIKEEEILEVSAKTGQSVGKVLEKIIEKVPRPNTATTGEDGPFLGLVFDSFYDNYQGVVAFIRVFSGEIKKGDLLYLVNQKVKFSAREVGFFKPKRVSLPLLSAGQIGWLETGLKEVEKVKVGETVVLSKSAENIKALAGYREPRPLVFANLFPSQEQNFELLNTNLRKLALTDTALTLEIVNNPYLGRGLRAGFLGLLHLEIISERLLREYQTKAVLTSPSVVFKLKLKNKKELVEIHSPAEVDSVELIDYWLEPWVKLEIICPHQYLSSVHQLAEEKRGRFLNSSLIDQNTSLLYFSVPLIEIIEDFLDKLKSLSQGFASFSYRFDCYQKSDLVRLDFLVSKELKPSLAKIIHRSKAEKEGRAFLSKLKEALPALNFSQSLQAVIGGAIIAREDIKARRKDVTAPLYGGDVTRKRKLLDRQKKGKKELALKGRTRIPEEVYLKLIKR